MDKRINILILGGIILVIVFTLVGFALADLEHDDFPLVETNRITRVRGILSYRTILAGVPLGVFALILIFEFLQGHIGEKRFAERKTGGLGLIVLFELLRGHIGEKRFTERMFKAEFQSYFYLVFPTTAHLGRRLCSCARKH